MALVAFSMRLAALCTTCVYSTSIAEYRTRLGLDELTFFSPTSELVDKFFAIREDCDDDIYRATDTNENALSKNIEIIAALQFLSQQPATSSPCVRTFVNKSSKRKKLLGIADDDDMCKSGSVNNGPTTCNVYDMAMSEWLLVSNDSQCSPVNTVSLAHLCERTAMVCQTESGTELNVQIVAWELKLNDNNYNMNDAKAADIDSCIESCLTSERCDAVTFNPFDLQCTLIDQAWLDVDTVCEFLNNEAFVEDASVVTIKVKSSLHGGKCYKGIRDEECLETTTAVVTTTAITPQIPTMKTTTLMTTETTTTTRAPTMSTISTNNQSSTSKKNSVAIIFATDATPSTTMKPTSIKVSTTISISIPLTTTTLMVTTTTALTTTTTMTTTTTTTTTTETSTTTRATTTAQVTKRKFLTIASCKCIEQVIKQQAELYFFEEKGQVSK